MKHKAYTEQDHVHIVDGYLRLVGAQIKEQPINKAQLVREIMGKIDRTRGAVEAKFMNLSAVAVKEKLLPQLPGGYVKGYKPAPNGAAALTPLLIERLTNATL